MRKLIRVLQGQHLEQMRSTSGVIVHFGDSPGPCPKCQGPMHVRKTFKHKGLTLAHGQFTACETEYCCAAGCTEVGTDGKTRLVVRRQPKLARLLLPRSAVGYDLMARIGVARFLHNHQREEIRSEIAAEFGIKLSAGEVSELSKRFCVYLKALHVARAPALRKLFESDGGWPLHFDATGEDGLGTLLVCYAGWRKLVVGSWKIPTERADAILPRLKEVAELFGAPCSLMHDLGRAAIEASRDFLSACNKSIPNLACHLHFVADVGKGLLEEPHNALRALFRRSKIAPRLRALVRDLGRKLGTDIGTAREKVALWFERDDREYQIPEGAEGLGVVRALAQWVLDYPADGSDKGFPFDRPYYDFFTRCMKLCRTVEAFLSRPHDDVEAYVALKRLFAIVITARNQVPFGRQAAVLAGRAKLLDELRQTLRIELKPARRNQSLPTVLSPDEAAVQLRDIEADLGRFAQSLPLRLPERGLAQDSQKANAIVLAHLDRHGPSLFGHLITLPQSAGGGIRQVERTNVMLESLFHFLKHGMRRRSGRKNLNQDLEHLPPESMLAMNLEDADYLAVLCNGSLDHLPQAFADLDAGHRDRSLPARAASAPTTGEAVSSSMPTADLRIVRTENVANRIEAAARSRAARLA